MAGSVSEYLFMFRASTGEAKGKIRELRGELAGIGDESKSSLAALGGFVAKSAVIATAAVVALGVGAVDLASKYQEATTEMQTQAGITEEQAKKIGDAFLTTGGTSKWSAETIMKAFAPVAGQLAQVNGAALDAKQSLDFMNKAQALAVATGQDLGTTTAGLAKTMQALKIPLDDVGSATDMLYNTSRVTATPVTQIAESVDKLHMRLGPLAPSLGDINTLFLDFVEHGGQAGRGLMMVNTAFTTLTKTSKPVEAELKNMGLAGDALWGKDGTFIGMDKAMAMLGPKLATMTEHQRLNAEATLFGSSAGKAMDDMILAGAAGWDKASEAVNKHGTVQESATAKSKDLAFQMERAKSSVVDLGIKFGQALMPIVATVVAWFNENVVPMLMKVEQWFEKNKDAIVGGFATAFTVAKNIITPFVAILGFLFQHLNVVLPLLIAIVGPILAWKAAMMIGSEIKKGFDMVMGGIRAVQSAYETARIGLMYAADWAKGVASSIASMAQAAAAWVAEKARWIADMAERAAVWVANGALYVADAVARAAEVSAAWLAQKVEFLAGQAEALAGWLVTNGIMTAAAIATGIAAAAAFMLPLLPFILIGAAVTALVVLIVTHWNQVKAVTSAVWGAISKFFTGVWDGFKNIITGFFKWIIGIFATLFDIVTAPYRMAWTAAVAIFNTVKGFIGTAIDDIKGFFSGLGQHIADVFNGVATTIHNIWDDIVNVVKSAVNTVIDIINGIIGGINDVTGAIPFIGSSMQIPKIPHWMAGGGYVDRPTLAVIGEAGPEWVVNQAQMRALQLGMTGEGGGDTHVIVNNPAQTTDVVTAIDQQKWRDTMRRRGVVPTEWPTNMQRVA